MDPFLERHWRDVHQTLITYAREDLNKRLPADLQARSEERVSVEHPDDFVRVIVPDVRVVDQGPGNWSGIAEGADPRVAQPVVIEVEAEDATEGYVVILDAAGQLVTVIEFISPSNKRGEGLEEYVRKRKELIQGGVNVVEIDLVRKGDWRALFKPSLPGQHKTPYRVTVRRARNPRRVELYPIRMQDRLPAIAIPLRETDADTRLDLQPLIDRAYESGRYETLSYRMSCDPPLEDDDAAWADEVLRKAGRR